jgi:4-alpha-glucanotransferase
LSTALSTPLPGLWSQRRAGVLLHPSSLPGPNQCGVLGDDARRFIDLIAAAGFSVWQVLPLGPVDASHSPYLLKSVNAGNPELIDRARFSAPTAEGLRNFCEANRSWLNAYALFVALRERYAGAPWWEWPADLRNLDADAIAAARAELREPMRGVIFEQFLFDHQWSDLRSYAQQRGVQIVGDLPFYVDYDSVEVWWHRSLFKLNSNDQPEVVAGVPPDYFSEDGQRWGNPVYDWDVMRTDGFRWWRERIAHQLQRFDALRIDHFRALESCWEIPADSPTARAGSWVPVPGDELLTALSVQFPDLPLFAEDLGTITPPVHALREKFGLPGMLVLQFGFDGTADNPYLPANHSARSVVYTGTHDNDTTRGWFDSLDEPARQAVRTHIENADDMPDALIRTAYASPAQLAVMPMQDLLGLGTEARLNVPGTASGNWEWRFDWAEVPADFAERFGALASASDRC